MDLQAEMVSYGVPCLLFAITTGDVLAEGLGTPAPPTHWTTKDKALVSRSLAWVIVICLPSSIDAVINSAGRASARNFALMVVRMISSCEGIPLQCLVNSESTPYGYNSCKINR